MASSDDPAAIFATWERGEVGGREALAALAPALRALDAEIAALEQRRAKLRDWLSRLVEALGGRSALAGIGRFEISNPSVIVSYDRKAVDELLFELDVTDPPLAERLRAARRESMRAGGLRFMPERGAAE